MAELTNYFAKTEEEALQKYEQYKSVDPFPSVLPALLSSAQIQAYIAKVGMVYPYTPAEDPKNERVTSASLTMTVGSEVLYWDEEGKQQYRKEVGPGEDIVLRPNSITFLRPNERFNLPDYIAARFNLRIVHVHRGLLLGTGPLLDPGYKGYPMVPVHNLTDSEYTLHVGDEFINVEFTKLSCEFSYNFVSSDETTLPFTYIENRGKTFDYSFIRFIDKNVPQRKVKSSLSEVIDSAKKQAFRITIGSIVALVVAIISIAGLVYGGYQLTVSTTNIIDEARGRMDRLKKDEKTMDMLQAAMAKLQKQVDDLNARDKRASTVTSTEDSAQSTHTQNGPPSGNPRPGIKGKRSAGH